MDKLERSVGEDIVLRHCVPGSKNDHHPDPEEGPKSDVFRSSGPEDAEPPLAPLHQGLAQAVDALDKRRDIIFSSHVGCEWRTLAQRR